MESLSDESRHSSVPHQSLAPVVTNQEEAQEPEEAPGDPGAATADAADPKPKKEHEFTIGLRHATLSFDGSKKRPNGTSADWKPSYAVAEWSDWSKNEQSGQVTTTPNAAFSCMEAAKVSTGAPASDLQVHWGDGTASFVTIKKKLKFKQQVIQITLFAAKQHPSTKQGGGGGGGDPSTKQPKPPKLCDEKTSKAIALGEPFLIDLCELAKYCENSKGLPKERKYVSQRSPLDILTVEVTYQTLTNTDAPKTGDAVTAPEQQEEQFKKLQEIKKMALSCSASSFKLTSEEFGMLRLRQGFLMSQPLLSDIVRYIMLPFWFPGAEDDVCFQYFRTNEGPWDIFEIIHFLQPKRTEEEGSIFKLLTNFLFSRFADEKRDSLVKVLSEIFVSRNWWAHVRVVKTEGGRALQAIINFVMFVLQSTHCTDQKIIAQAERVMSNLGILIKDMNSDVQLERNLSLDDISYILFLRASRHLCQYCDTRYKKFPNCEFSSNLMERKLDLKKTESHLLQSDVIELRDITAAVKKCSNCTEKIRFDCKLISKTRNALAHAPQKENRVILVLLFLGAAARLITFLSKHFGNASSMSEDTERVISLQAELLGHSELLEPNAFELLIEWICASNDKALEQSCFKDLFCGDNFRKIQMLLQGKMAGHVKLPAGAGAGAAELSAAAPLVTEVAASLPTPTPWQNHKKYLSSLLRMITHIPPKHRDSARNSLIWLFDASTQDREVFLNCCGFQVLKHDLDAPNSFIFSQIATDHKLQELRSRLDEMHNQCVLECICPEFCDFEATSSPPPPTSSSSSSSPPPFESDISASRHLLREFAKYFRRNGLEKLSSLADSVATMLSAVESEKANMLIYAGSFRTSLSVLQESETKLASALPEYHKYHQAHLYCAPQTFRDAKALFSAVSDETSETGIALWDSRIKKLNEFIKASPANEEESNKFLGHILKLACSVHHYLVVMVASKRLFNMTFNSRVTTCINYQMQMLFSPSESGQQELLTQLQKFFPTSVASNDTWLHLQSATAHVFNESRHFCFECVPKPGSFVLFSGSVAQKSGHAVWGKLFRHCVDVLKPMLDLHKFDCNEIERVLESHLFDAISCLSALASVHLHPQLELITRPFLVTEFENESGMRAAISASDVFITRTDSIKFKDCIRAVFTDSDCADQHHRVLVWGQPGNGKSQFVTQHFAEIQQEFDRNLQRLPVYRHVFPARGKEAVLNGLHMMGLALASHLKIESNAEREDVLGDANNREDKLQDFLVNHRYVIFADDVDEEGLKELLRHVPESSEPCALILTSQENLEGVLRRPIRPGAALVKDPLLIQLDVFSPEESKQLVQQVCKDVAADHKALILEDGWLNNVLQNDLGQNPLGVFIFSDWLKSVLPVESIDSLKYRWKQTLSVVSSRGTVLNRGFQATVRLSLQRIRDKHPHAIESARCFFQIMALTDPNDRNLWSLFDPEIPYLFIPESENTKLPQLNLRNYFASIKQRTKERCGRQKDSEPIPLLEELNSERFRSFVENISKESPLITITRDSKGQPVAISMHQLIQDAINIVLEDTRNEFLIILLELLKSRVYLHDKAAGIGCVKSYYSTTARSVCDILGKLATLVRIDAGPLPFEDSLTDAIVGSCEEPKEQGISWLLYRLDRPRESFESTLNLLRLVKKIRLSQLESLLEVQRKCCIEGPLFRFELSWQYDLCYLYCACRSLSDTIHVKDIPIYIDDKHWYQFPGTESNEEPNFNTIFHIVRTSFELFQNGKFKAKKLSRLFKEFSQRLHERLQDFSSQEKNTVLLLSKNIYSLSEIDPSGRDEFHHLRTEIKKKLKFNRSPFDEVEQRSLYPRAYGCYAIANVLFTISTLQRGQSRKITLSNAIEWSYDAFLCAYVTKADGHTNIVWRKELLARCLGASGDHYQESLYLFSSCLSRLYHDSQSNASEELKKWLCTCRFWMISTLKEMETRDAGALNRYNDWLNDWINGNFDGFKNRACIPIEKLQDKDDLRLFQELRKYLDGKKVVLALETPGIDPEYNFECQKHDATTTLELIEHNEVLALLNMREFQAGFFVRPQQPGFLNIVGVPQKCFVREDELRRMKVFEFLQKNHQHYGEIPWWKMLQKDVNLPKETDITARSLRRWRIGFRNVAKEDNAQSVTRSLGQEKIDLAKHISHLDSISAKSAFFAVVFPQSSLSCIMMLQYSTFDHRASQLRSNQKLVDGAMIAILLQSSDLKIKDHPRLALEIVKSALKRNERLYIGAEEVLGPLLCICANLDDEHELDEFWKHANGLSEYFCKEILESHNIYQITKAWAKLKERIVAATQRKPPVLAPRTQPLPAIPATDQSSACTGAPTAAVGSGAAPDILVSKVTISKPPTPVTPPFHVCSA